MSRLSSQGDFELTGSVTTATDSAQLKVVMAAVTDTIGELECCPFEADENQCATLCATWRSCSGPEGPHFFFVYILNHSGDEAA